MTDVETVIAQLMPHLEELQSQLAFHEDTVASLNEAVVAQQQEIMTLTRQLTLLKQRQDEQAGHVEASGGADVLDEKPPHY